MFHWGSRCVTTALWYDNDYSMSQSLLSILRMQHMNSTHSHRDAMDGCQIRRALLLWTSVRSQSLALKGHAATKRWSRHNGFWTSFVLIVKLYHTFNDSVRFISCGIRE